MLIWCYRYSLLDHNQVEWMHVGYILLCFQHTHSFRIKFFLTQKIYTHRGWWITYTSNTSWNIFSSVLYIFGENSSTICIIFNLISYTRELTVKKVSKGYFLTPIYTSYEIHVLGKLFNKLNFIQLFSFLVLANCNLHHIHLQHRRLPSFIQSKFITR